ncbi:unnamed protein product [Mytilus coruscus]|uniref:Uncharacterized protein n=1 Tax=Mytilus coruscus TaxID=42192 RepID=A0A6J8BPN9_MYTCO|nr:unnamed protein product [Mytilus coruscus]
MGTRVYTPPARFYPGRLPPTFIHTRILIPFDSPKFVQRNPVPPTIFPVGTVYPSSGRQFPNPLEDLNTYDLPPWKPTAHVFNNGIVGPDVDKIIPQFPKKLHQDPQIPTREEIAEVPAIQKVPTFPDTNNEYKSIPDFPSVLVPVVVPNPPQIPIFPVADINKNQNGNDYIEQQTTQLPPIIVERPKSCQETGCGLGSECVYNNSYICPKDIADIPCRCQRGCRIQYTFIPLGVATIIDPCGNICSCNSLFGGANCTDIPCNPKQPLINNPTTGLILEPVQTGKPDAGPLRGDFPANVPSTTRMEFPVTIPGQQRGNSPVKVPGRGKPNLSFPEQTFVPPIPFLTESKLPGFNGHQGLPMNSKVRLSEKNLVSDKSKTDSMVFPVAG